jgi:hypothetical protein
MKSVIAAALCVCGVGWGAVPRVMVDGRDCSGEVFDLEGARPEERTTVFLERGVWGWWERIMRLPRSSPEMEYRLETRGKGTLLVWKDEGGDRGPVIAMCTSRESVESMQGVLEAARHPAAAQEYVDPLEALSPEQIGALWHLCLPEWSEKVAGVLAKADLAGVVIDLVRSPRTQEEAAAMGRVLGSVRFLSLAAPAKETPGEGKSFEAFLAAVARQNALRSLLIRASSDAPAFSPRLLKDCTTLECLVLEGSVTDPTELGHLKNLQVLYLRETKELRALGFLAGMSNLRTLNVEETSVTDLRPIGMLAKLRAVYAQGAPITRLPDVAMPALELLDVTRTKVNADAVAAFAAKNPRARILRLKRDALLYAAEGATRVRVCKVGNDLGSISRDTSIDVSDGVEAAAFLANLRFDEGAGDFFCHCFGDFTIELCREDRVLVSLRCHHSRSLSSELWSSDALMTEETATFLCCWLAERGLRWPQLELENAQKRIEEGRALLQEYGRIIPKSLVTALGLTCSWRLGGVGTEASDLEVPSIIGRECPDPVARATLCFRVLGCRLDASWQYWVGFEMSMRECLDSVDREPLGKAARQVLGDVASKSGVARFIFGESKWESFDRVTLDDLLPTLSAWALSHPEKTNRWRTMGCLQDIGGPQAIAALRSVLDGKVKIRPANGDPTGKAADVVSVSPNDPAPGVDSSERARAALLLARLGVKDIRDTVRELQANAQGEDADTLAEALRLLE